MWRKHCFGAKRNYTWRLKKHIKASCLTINHLIIIGKCFLYIGAHDEKRPQLTDFVTLVNEKIELEKYIAITSNELLSFNKKWSNFLSN